MSDMASSSLANWDGGHLLQKFRKLAPGSGTATPLPAARVALADLDAYASSDAGTADAESEASPPRPNMLGLDESSTELNHTPREISREDYDFADVIEQHSIIDMLEGQLPSPPHATPTSVNASSTAEVSSIDNPTSATAALYRKTDSPESALAAHVSLIADSVPSQTLPNPAQHPSALLGRPASVERRNTSSNISATAPRPPARQIARPSSRAISLASRATSALSSLPPSPAMVKSSSLSSELSALSSLPPSPALPAHRTLAPSAPAPPPAVDALSSPLSEPIPDLTDSASPSHLSSLGGPNTPDLVPHAPSAPAKGAATSAKQLKRRGRRMSHVLVPPLPPGVSKSKYRDMMLEIAGPGAGAGRSVLRYRAAVPTPIAKPAATHRGLVHASLSDAYNYANRVNDADLDISPLPLPPPPRSAKSRKRARVAVSDEDVEDVEAWAQELGVEMMPSRKRPTKRAKDEDAEFRLRPAVSKPGPRANRRAKGGDKGGPRRRKRAISVSSADEMQPCAGGSGTGRADPAPASPSTVVLPVNDAIGAALALGHPLDDDDDDVRPAARASRSTSAAPASPRDRDPVVEVLDPAETVWYSMSWGAALSDTAAAACTFVCARHHALLVQQAPGDHGDGDGEDGEDGDDDDDDQARETALRAFTEALVRAGQGQGQGQGPIDEAGQADALLHQGAWDEIQMAGHFAGAVSLDLDARLVGARSVGALTEAHREGADTDIEMSTLFLDAGAAPTSQDHGLLSPAAHHHEEMADLDARPDLCYASDSLSVGGFYDGEGAAHPGLKTTSAEFQNFASHLDFDPLTAHRLHGSDDAYDPVSLIEVDDDGAGGAGVSVGINYINPSLLFGPLATALSRSGSSECTENSVCRADSQSTSSADVVPVEQASDTRESTSFEIVVPAGYGAMSNVASGSSTEIDASRDVSAGHAREPRPKAPRRRNQPSGLSASTSARDSSELRDPSSGPAGRYPRERRRPLRFNDQGSGLSDLDIPSDYEATAKTASTSRKGKGKAKADGVHSFPVDGRPMTCHQCRRFQKFKMPCSTCHKWYCPSCIEKRYPKTQFDALTINFVCPFCSGTCNCTNCIVKRGLIYQKTIDPPTPTDSHTSTPPPEVLALGVGVYWGTVYSVEDCEREGEGLVAADNTSIVLHRPPPVVKPKQKRRRLIGRPFKGFKSIKPRPRKLDPDRIWYIGKRVRHAKVSKEEVPPEPGPSAPIRAAEVQPGADADMEGSDADAEGSDADAEGSVAQSESPLTSLPDTEHEIDGHDEEPVLGQPGPVIMSSGLSQEVIERAVRLSLAAVQDVKA